MTIIVEFTVTHQVTLTVEHPELNPSQLWVKLREQVPSLRGLGTELATCVATHSKVVGVD